MENKLKSPDRRNRNRLLTGVSMLLVLLLGMAAHAASTSLVVTHCDRCTDQQHLNAALAVAPVNGGQVYVADSALGILRHFSVTLESRSGQAAASIREIPTDPEIEAHYESIFAFQRWLRHPKPLALPEHFDFQSAYEVVNHDNRTYAISNWLNGILADAAQMSGFSAAMLELLPESPFESVSGVEPMMKLPGLSTSLRVDFPDGSQLGFESDLFFQLADRRISALMFKVTGGRDADGNRIHTSPDGYHYQSGMAVGLNARRLANLLSRLQLEINHAAGKPVEGMQCDWHCGDSQCTFDCSAHEAT